eukprot:CAMPEP_0194218760 /NCGR_PEP_ID=MMETSP0156-20130528/24509_1 /TAXON_ID=33649 /ORGANISM="Thalassionema nitzschioides, Strain L26-B" /LENGTH=459 /DNA_ID=CAMNT_0038948225 /DNA_START=124 /DNA_END=1503 /DNA_ORIENTATION=-
MRQSVLTPQHHYAVREETPIEDAVESRWEEAGSFVDKIPEEERETLTYEPKLKGAIFLGHILPDADSILGAIIAAKLYDGVPARAGDINTETQFVLDRYDGTAPETIESLLEADPERKVCVVDFQQQTQLHPCVPMKNIVGIIDHHALQSATVITLQPIFVDIRPWGCACTILAHSFAVQEKFLPKNLAGMALSGILSDTLNLRSPTTTEWDKRMVSMLVQYIDPSMDVNMLAAAQFRAKSRELSIMTPYQLVNGDTKKFKFTDSKDPTLIREIGYGVIETTDASASLARAKELIVELDHCRDDDNLICFFLAIVDIVNMTSYLLIAGPVEKSLALEAYGGEISLDGTHLELKGCVSRKKDFVPGLTSAFEKGWAPPAGHRRSLMRKNSKIVMNNSPSASHPWTLSRVFEGDEESSTFTSFSTSISGASSSISKSIDGAKSSVSSMVNAAKKSLPFIKK